MRVRFQADADLDARIIRGLKRKQPEIDFQTAQEARLRGVADPDVLRVAADAGRVLVTHDRRTMPAHFAEFIEPKHPWRNHRSQGGSARRGHRRALVDLGRQRSGGVAQPAGVDPLVIAEWQPGSSPGWSCCAAARNWLKQSERLP